MILKGFYSLKAMGKKRENSPGFLFLKNPKI
jgi:hypothetical protein